MEKITKSEHKQILSDLKNFQTQLEEVQKIIAQALELGDLSENEEYSTALQHRLDITNSIQEIQLKLNACEIVEEDFFSNVIQPGSIVAIRKKSNNSQTKDEWRLLKLGSLNSTVTAQVLDTDSPLGRAILQQSPGIFKVEHHELGSIFYEVRLATSNECSYYNEHYPSKESILDRLFNI